MQVALKDSNSRIEGTKDSRIRGARITLLREEQRARPIAVVGNVEIPVAELEEAAVEVEAERAREDAITIWRPVIARKVDPQVIHVLETVGVGEEHGSRTERPETDFISCVFHDDTRTADGTSTMTNAELGGDDEDVRIALGLREVVPELHGAGRLAEMLLVNFALAVVIELFLASLVQGIEDGLHRLAVSRTEDLRILLPVGDCEPALGVCGELSFAIRDLREQFLIAEAESREQLAELVALGVHIQGLFVTREIAELGFGFLVGELHTIAVFGDEASDEVGETCCLVDTLCLCLRETGLGIGGTHDGHEFETLGVAFGNQRNGLS